MATAKKIQSDISSLKIAIRVAKNDAIKKKLKSRLEMAENELASIKSGAKPRKVSTTKGTKSLLERAKALVKKNPKFARYKGSGVDLEKDAKEGARETGRRISKGLKGNQYASKEEAKGNVYYEYRVNRLDVKQPKKKQTYPKLEDGGYMAKGGLTKDSIVRTLTSDKSQYFLEKDGNGYILYISPRGAMNSTFHDKFNVEDLGNEGTKRKYKLTKLEDGGMMAKGGMTKYKIVQDVSDYDDPSGLWLVLDENGNKLGEFDFKLEAQEFVKDLKSKNSKSDGGYMANGGVLGDRVKLKEGFGYWDLSKYKYGNDFKRFKGGEEGVFIKGTRKLGNELRIKLDDGREIITQIQSIDLPTYEEKDNLYEKNKHLFSFGFEDGGMMANEPKYDGAGFTREDDMRIIVKSGNNGNLKEVFNAFKNQKNELAANEIFDEEKSKGKSVFIFVGDDLYDQYIQDEDESQYAKGGYMAKGGMTAHGLQVGDEIIGHSDNNVIVKDRISKKIYVININNGTRLSEEEFEKLGSRERTKFSKMAHGGETHRAEDPEEVEIDEDEMKVVRGYSDDEAYEYAKGGMTLKAGDIVEATTGVKLKVLDFKPDFGGRALVQRIDEFGEGLKPAWMPLTKFKLPKLI